MRSLGAPGRVSGTGVGSARSAFFLAGAAALLIAAASAGAPAPLRAAPLPELCVGCVEVRVGPPIVLRGPGPNEPDAPFSMIRLGKDKVRGFAANGATFAIDGANPADMGGPKRAVMNPGPKGTASECGAWLNSVWTEGGKLYGLVHNESDCEGGAQTHKSMSIAVSTDQGLTWTSLGTAIAAGDQPARGTPTGEGDCTAINGHDGFLYAYCQRLADWKNTVARAPRADPAPGRWLKWDGAAWRMPALGGRGAALQGPVGMNAAYWTDRGAVLLLAAADSLRLSLSTDKVRFTPLAEPLILTDGSDWKRPAPTDLYAYPALMTENGATDISRDALLTYTYIPPGEDFTQRYLVMHDIRLRARPGPVAPQVGVALSRWTSIDDGRRWTTAGPPIEERSGRRYRFDKTLGYLMTAPPAAPSVTLQECEGERGGRPDYRLAEEGGCEPAGYRRRRAAGYAYRDEQRGTVPLYECAAPESGRRFASNRADCEGLGRAERRLGFLLAD